MEGGVEGCEGFPIIPFAAETSAVEGSIVRREVWKTKVRKGMSA
jgi:hypothetical protein